MPPCRLAWQEAEFWLPWRKATGSPGNSPPPCRLARQEAEFWLPWREATGSPSMLPPPCRLARQEAEFWPPWRKANESPLQSRLNTAQACTSNNGSTTHGTPRPVDAPSMKGCSGPM